VDPNLVLYYEDIELDQVRRSPMRTVTVADIVNFAGVSGDFAELHLSDVPPEGSLFAGRIAHGLLGMVIQNTQGGQAFKTAGVALLGFDWRFLLPILAGDTVHTRAHASAKRLSASRPGLGVVTWQRELVNQRDEVVQAGTSTLLVRCRDAVKP
jgi:acyl dehydratase